MSNDNVIELDNVTKLDLPPERILNKALEADLASAVVIGWDQDGDFFFAGSIASGPETLWLLELAKKHLLEV
jgi:hypothetical protein